MPPEDRYLVFSDLRTVASGVGTMGTGGYIVAPKFMTCTPCILQVKDAASVRILSKDFNYKIG